MMRRAPFTAMGRLVSAVLLLSGAALVGGCEANRTFVSDAARPDRLACLPDLDGAITSAELPVTWRRPARYRISAANRRPMVDTAGTLAASGGAGA